MKIWQEGKRVHLQLADMDAFGGFKMLFDFTVEEERYEELRHHIIEHLDRFSPECCKDKELIKK